MDELLQQGTRRRLYEEIRARPGSSARELQRSLGLGWGETAYHLDQLTRAGLLHREKGGGSDHYFVREVTWEDRKTLILLRSPAERAILLALLSSPGLTFPEVVERVALSRSTVSFHLHLMLEAGVVDGPKEGNVRRYQPREPERVRLLLQKFHESFEDRLVDRFVETFAGIFRE